MFQGIIGETYNRMLVGPAVHDPKNAYFLPNDYTFHGKGTEDSYIVDGCFGETANTMFNQVRHAGHVAIVLCYLQGSSAMPMKSVANFTPESFTPSSSQQVSPYESEDC